APIAFDELAQLLNQRCRVSVGWVGERDKAPQHKVQLPSDALPAHLLLTLACAQLKLDWNVVHGLAVVGDAGPVQSFAQRAAQHEASRSQIVKAANQDQQFARSLLRSLFGGFDETPIDQVVDFLVESLETNIQLKRDDLPPRFPDESKASIGP